METLIHEHNARVIGLLSEALRGQQPGKAPQAPGEVLEGLAALDEADGRLAAAQGGRLPDAEVARRYGLDGVERALLWLAVASWLEPELRDLIARANDSLLRHAVDPSLCLRLFGQDRGARARVMAALAPSSALVGADLVTLRMGEAGGNWLYRELSPSPQAVAFVGGLRTLSARAGQLAARRASVDLRVEDLAGLEALAPLVRLARRVYQRDQESEAKVSGALAGPRGLAVVIEGGPGQGRVTAARALAGSLERGRIELDAAALQSVSFEHSAAVVQDVVLASELLDEPLIIQAHATLVGGASTLAGVLSRALERHRAFVVLCLGVDEEVAPGLDGLVVRRCRLEPVTDVETLAAQWRVHLAAPGLDASRVDAARLSRRLQLTPAQIRKASALARLEGEPDATTRRVALDDEAIEAAVRLQVPRTIGPFATITEPALAVDDLIVDEEVERYIHELISAARHRRRVLETWGLGRHIRRGTGIIALFDGDPGTGKTHASEVIAASLGLNLVRINIASIVDKYIGETEKNLTQIFDRARPDTSLLLFDEADSLFSKRTTNVSKSTDRYSNMNINVLLQLVERYEGVTILTTNLKRAIDPAFERRFTYKVHFPMPGQPERERIWRYLLPEDVEVGEAIDYEWLSEVELSGGEIKNAILLAAYRAAHEDARITNNHLHETACREATAAGRMVRHFEPREGR